MSPPWPTLRLQFQQEEPDTQLACPPAIPQTPASLPVCQLHHSYLPLERKQETKNKTTLWFGGETMGAKAWSVSWSPAGSPGIKWHGQVREWRMAGKQPGWRLSSVQDLRKQHSSPAHKEHGGCFLPTQSVSTAKRKSAGNCPSSGWAGFSELGKIRNQYLMGWSPNHIEF